MEFVLSVSCFSIPLDETKLRPRLVMTIAGVWAAKHETVKRLPSLFELPNQD